MRLRMTLVNGKSYDLAYQNVENLTLESVLLGLQKKLETVRFKVFPTTEGLVLIKVDEIMEIR